MTKRLFLYRKGIKYNKNWIEAEIWEFNTDEEYKKVINGGIWFRTPEEIMRLNRNEHLKK